MWRTVFASNGGRIQRSSSTSSSMDLINEQRLAGGLSYGLESRANADSSELQQQSQLAKKKNSNVKLRKKEEKNARKQQQQQQLEGQATEEQPQDYLSIKSSLIESKKKLTKKLNIKFRQAPSEKIKRRTYEQMECAVILNDINKMSALLREYPKLNLATNLRPDGTTLLHTAVRYQCKDALSWLASRCNRFQINQQNTAGDSPLHCAVRERSPILVNILLNHKACNHVQNYTTRSTPLLLALGLYIKYRNLKDCACVPGHSEPASSRSNSTASERSAAVQDCFCQKKEKSFDLLQLETNNNRHPRGGLNAGRAAGKFDAQRPVAEHQKENDSSNLNRLISQSAAAMRYGGGPHRNHPSSNKLDDLTADFLNRQNCCRAGDLPANCPLPNSYRSDNEAINNCRLMRKIVMAILHDSDPSSWRLANAHGQTVIRMAKENQVDFVYDFISNYQKLAVIMKPAQADQNNNHYSAADAFQTAFKQDVPQQEHLNGGLNGHLNNVLQQEHLKEHLNGNLPEHLQAVGPKVPTTVSQVASEIRAATICDYYLPTFKPAFSKHLQGEKVVEEEVEEEEESSLDFENATMNKTNGGSAASSEAAVVGRATVKSETHSTNQHCPTEASRFVSSYTNRNEQRNEFNGRSDAAIGHSSGRISSSSSSSSKPAVNQHKRKTDDEQQYCSALRGQRSIIRADNFLPFTKSSAVCGHSSAAGCSVTNSINRKSNRSRSITLGHINLLDRNHNLFTSSCSLNRLSELENRKALDHSRQFNNRDQFGRPADQLHFEQQQKLRNLPNSFDYIQQQQQPPPFDEAPVTPVTYSNIPNEFRDCQQFAASKQSIGCSRSDAIAKQPSLMKTALAVYR